MRYDLFRKGFVIGMIFLFVGASVLPVVNCGFLRNDNVSTTLKTRTLPSTMNNIITVDDEGDGDYTSIQDAINHATNGDTIEVYSGIYIENVIVDKMINLEGIDSELGSGSDTGRPIIDGSGENDVVIISADRVNMSKFTIQNSDLGDNCIVITSSYNRFHDNIVFSVSYGITVESNNNHIYNNTFSGNNGNRGIKLWYSSQNCNISRNNISGSFFGIDISYGCDNNKIYKNTLTSNAVGLKLGGSHSNLISENIIILNDYEGMRICFHSDNNTISGNTICSNGEEGIDLYDFSNNNIILGNTIENNNIGIKLGNCSNNTIYNNYFNNTYNAWDDGNNKWNIAKTPGANIIGGSYLGGNYWSDYTGVDSNGDEIGDTPYSILGGSNQDSYPLMFDTFPPEIRLDKPTKGYWYLFNNEMWATQSGKTIIIGKIDVEVYAIDYSSGVDRVEIFIDDGIWDVTYNQHGQIIYSFLLDETLFGEHTIKAVAYDNRDNTNMTELKVNVFSIRLPRPPG